MNSLDDIVLYKYKEKKKYDPFKDVMKTIIILASVFILFLILFVITNEPLLMFFGVILLILAILTICIHNNEKYDQYLYCYAKENDGTIWKVKVIPKQVALCNESNKVQSYTPDYYSAQLKAQEDEYIKNDILFVKKRMRYNNFYIQEDKVEKITNIRIDCEKDDYYIVFATINDKRRVKMKVYKCFENIDDMLGICD